MDPDLGAALQARQEWRRNGAIALVGRLTDEHGAPRAEAVPDVIDVLFTLTSFETFDNLAGATRKPEDVVALVRRLAHAALELEEG